MKFYNDEEDDRWDPFSHVGGEIIHFGFLKLIMMHNICFHYLSSISIPIHHGNEEVRKTAIFVVRINLDILNYIIEGRIQ